jgi:hypothetical protein
MYRVASERAEKRRRAPPAHPRRDLPLPSIDEPPEDPGAAERAPLGDPPFDPEAGDPTKIA